jgi:hypothetical protein
MAMDLTTDPAALLHFSPDHSLGGCCMLFLTTEGISMPGPTRTMDASRREHDQKLSCNTRRHRNGYDGTGRRRHDFWSKEANEPTSHEPTSPRAHEPTSPRAHEPTSPRAHEPIYLFDPHPPATVIASFPPPAWLGLLVIRERCPFKAVVSMGS